MSKMKTTSQISTTTLPKINLNCEIIEIFENEKNSIATLKFNAGIMELVIDPMKQYHLGDEISISGKLKIENVEQDISDTL